LKAVWERGDTTKLLDMFRNDVDSRMTLDLHALGSNTKISSPRPHIEKPNINTIEAPLTAEPVLGDNGYAGLDPKNFGEQLDQMRQHYDENPTLGGEAAYGTAIDNVIAAQRKGIEGVQKKRAEWAKEKSSPESEKKIASATNEIRDRELFVKMAESDKAKGMRRASDAKSREAARDDLMKRGDEAQAAEERSGAGGRNQ
jgi:hypothetical protein